jgi:hypothetical protein
MVRNRFLFRTHYSVFIDVIAKVLKRNPVNSVFQTVPQCYNCDAILTTVQLFTIFYILKYVVDTNVFPFNANKFLCEQKSLISDRYEGS